MNMNWFKAIIYGLSGLFIIYFALAIVVEIILYQNKGNVERAAPKMLLVEKVQIGGFINVPFLFIELKNVTLTDPVRGTIKLKTVRVFYNIFKLPFQGLLPSINTVSIDKITISSSLDKASQYVWDLYMINPDFRFPPGMDIRLKIGDVFSALGLFGTVKGDVWLHNLRYHLKGQELKGSTYLSVDNHMENKVDILQARMLINLKLNLTNYQGKGSIELSNLNLGGVNLVQKEELKFEWTSNSFNLEQGSNSQKKFLTRDEAGFHIRLAQGFTLKYPKHEAFYLFEHLLSEGNYQLSLRADLGTSDWSAFASVKPISGSDTCDASVEVKAGKTSVHSGIQGAKFGKGVIDLTFKTNDLLPAGRVQLVNFPVIEGLRLNGDLLLEAISNRMKVSGKSMGINGGYLGTAAVTVAVQSNGIILLPGKNFANVLIGGFITNQAVQVDFSMYNVPGSAIVSNIHIDLLGISRGTFDGKMRLTDHSNSVRIDAGLTGYESGYYRTKTMVETRLTYSDFKLSFPEVNYKNLGIILNGDFHFIVTNQDQTLIMINGGGQYRKKINIPFHARIFSDYQKNTTATWFNFDNRIDLNIDSVGAKTQLSLNTLKYPLKRLGLDGLLSLNYTMGFSNTQIENIRVESHYNITNREFVFYMKSTRVGPVLPIQHFMIDVGDDKIFGNGSLTQSGQKFSGSVEFIRGGQINFALNDNTINALLEMKSIFIKDFLQENQDVFISPKVFISGPIGNPDVTGGIKIVNAANSEPFLLDIPSITKRQDQFALNKVVYKTEDAQLQMDVDILLHSGENFSVFSKGDFSWYNMMKGRFSVNYFTKENQSSLSYDIKSFQFSGKTLTDMIGGFIFKDNRYTFYKKGDAGLTGFYEEHGTHKDWDVEFTEKDVKGYYTGNIKQKNINATLSVKLPLYLLSFVDVIRDIKGEAKFELKIKGETENPLLDGSLRLYQTSLSFKPLNTRLQNLNLDLSIANNKIVFQNVNLTTTTGNFQANGFMDITDLRNPAFNLKLMTYDKQLPSINMNINEPNFGLNGNILVRELALAGNKNAFALSGDIALENALVYVPINVSGAESKSDNSFVSNIVFNLPIKIGNNVKFSTEVNEIILRKDNLITLLGSMANNSFTIKGQLPIDRGSITYFGKDFLIKEGMVNFYGNPGDPDPYLNLITYYRTKDEKGENVDVYLTFDGKLSKIYLRDFYSNPEKTRNQIYAILGIQPLETQDINSGSSGQQLLISGVNTAENIFVLNPLAINLKRRLGLDLFTIRTGIVENFVRRNIAGETNTGLVNIWEGTSLTVGKYLFPSVFVQYEMTVSRNPYADLGLLPYHTLGLEFDLREFDLGWKLQPYSIGKDTKYEQKFELNFNRRF